MIKLRRKQDCCGCTACQSICSKDCISMVEDNEGFLYPITDISICINCNACNRVCPVIKLQGTESNKEFPTDTKAYAARINDNNILLGSSSGGIFTALANKIIEDGGVVYGAAWNDDGVVRHIKVDKLSELGQLRGSKYVQSAVSNCFAEIKDYLRQSRNVLFSGTPCQIAGLKSYLNKEYKNLLTVEVACHGAPSPKALHKYLQELRVQYGDDVELDFRAKPEGDWRNYKVTAYSGDRHFFYEDQKENIFMKGFLRELYSRPICYECPFKAGISGADITLADFWGIEQGFAFVPSKSGISLVLTHTILGDSYLKELSDIKYYEVPINKAVKLNSSLIHSEPPHPERKYYFKIMDSESFSSAVMKCISLRKTTQWKLRVKAYLKRFKNR